MTVERTSAGLFGEFFSDHQGEVPFKSGEEHPAILCKLARAENLE